MRIIKYILCCITYILLKDESRKKLSSLLAPSTPRDWRECLTLDTALKSHLQVGPMTGKVQQGAAADVPEEISGRMLSFLFLSDQHVVQSLTRWSFVIILLFNVDIHVIHPIHFYVAMLLTNRSFIISKEFTSVYICHRRCYKL